MGVERSGVPTGEVDYGISNISLDLRTQFLGSVAAIGSHLDAISPAPGIEAKMELTPNKSAFMRRLLVRGRDMELRRSDVYRGVPIQFADMVDQFTGLDRGYDWSDEDDVFKRIISGHASFLDETSGHGVMGLLFPGAQQSLRQLNVATSALERFDPVALVLDTELDGVVYGQHLGKPAYYTRDQRTAESQGALWTPFRSTRVQPKRADFEKMGISEDAPAEEILSTLEQHGIDRGTLDVAHIQTFDDPLSLVDKLAGWFDSIHLALNRKDILNVMGKDFGHRSARAKASFEQGEGPASKTLEWELAQRVVTNWKWRGHRGSIFYEEMAGTATNRQVRRYQKAILTTTATLVESTQAG